MPQEQINGVPSDSRIWLAGPGSGPVLEESIERVARWASGYLASLAERPVRRDTDWGAVLDRIEPEPPSEGVGLDALGSLIEEADASFVDDLVHWQSPRFFAYFPCSNSVPSIVGELMSAVLNVNGMLWSTSPSCTELEVRVMDWCAAMFGLDDAFRFDREGRGGGCIQGTASEAALAALCAARRRCTRRGADRGSVCLYVSDQAHSSVVKAAMIAGLADDADDRSRVRLIPTDGALRMDPGALRSAIRSDLDAGLTPGMVVATSGTTSTGAVDPIAQIAEVCASFGTHRPWLHIDAAWAGAAAVCEEHRWILGGHEHADSLCLNPHKWLLTNFDCDLFWVRDRDALTDSMSITPAYLRDESMSRSEIVNFRDWHVPLGRRMRALKLWLVIRCIGTDGLRAHIRGHCELAAQVERWIKNDPRFEPVFDRSLGLVCFRVVGDDERTARLVERVNARGRVMITRSDVPLEAGGSPRPIARVSVGAPSVDEHAVESLFGELDRCVGLE